MKAYAYVTRPLFITLNSRGFTLILSFASEGTASPNSTSVPMNGRLRQVCFQAARIAAFIPSFATEGSGSSSRSFKAINKGHVTIAQADPDAGWTAPIHIITTQKPGSRWTAWSFLWCSPSVLRRKSDIYQWEKKEDISKVLNRVGYEQLEEEY